MSSSFSSLNHKIPPIKKAELVGNGGQVAWTKGSNVKGKQKQEEQEENWNGAQVDARMEQSGKNGSGGNSFSSRLDLNGIQLVRSKPVSVGKGFVGVKIPVWGGDGVSGLDRENGTGSDEDGVGHYIYLARSSAPKSKSGVIDTKGKGRGKVNEDKMELDQESDPVSPESIANRTLFIVNLPLDFTTQDLIELFTPSVSLKLRSKISNDSRGGESSIESITFVENSWFSGNREGASHLEGVDLWTWEVQNQRGYNLPDEAQLFFSPSATSTSNVTTVDPMRPQNGVTTAARITFSHPSSVSSILRLGLLIPSSLKFPLPSSSTSSSRPNNLTGNKTPNSSFWLTMAKKSYDSNRFLVERVGAHVDGWMGAFDVENKINGGSGDGISGKLPFKLPPNRNKKRKRVGKDDIGKEIGSDSEDGEEEEHWDEAGSVDEDGWQTVGSKPQPKPKTKLKPHPKAAVNGSDDVEGGGGVWTLVQSGGRKGKSLLPTLDPRTGKESRDAEPVKVIKSESLAQRQREKERIEEQEARNGDSNKGKGKKKKSRVEGLEGFYKYEKRQKRQEDVSNLRNNFKKDVERMEGFRKGNFNGNGIGKVGGGNRMMKKEDRKFKPY